MYGKIMRRFDNQPKNDRTPLRELLYMIYVGVLLLNGFYVGSCYLWTQAKSMIPGIGRLGPVMLLCFYCSFVFLVLFHLTYS